MEGSGSGPAPRRRLGVIGTMVWDTIYQRDLRQEPVEEWGGVAYALSALVAALPAGWEVVPILKLGADLAESALRFLNTLPRVDLTAGIRVAAEPNNRVELRYQSEGRRTERLSGGVPTWLWPELGSVVRGCDALYVNFISGFELELDAARALRDGYSGPIYADLHSLFLGVGRQGLRTPRELPSSASWLRCFDAVQLNEEEFDLLSREWGDPWLLAAGAVGPELKLILVTLGPRGAAYVAGPGFQADPSEWPRTRRRVATPGPTKSGRVAPAGAALAGDPTGCGDVWGATFFARLLAGDDLEAAMATANGFAARNVEHRGAAGLHRHLLGRLSPGESVA